MKKKDVVFILDKSGSMRGLEQDTIGGFNSLLKKQKKENVAVRVSTILFDECCSVLHDRIPIDFVKEMTRKDYCVGGCTALLDAVGCTISHMEKDCSSEVLFVIITDGMENSSCEYSYGQVKRLIEQHKEKDGWEFLFLGANIDAAKEAGRFGIDEDSSVDYCCDQEGTELNFKVLSNVVSDFACGVGLNKKEWKKEIEEDYKRRG